MNLRQLRYLCEIADQNLNLSSAAKVLHTSQPGISKQIKLLEEELGIDILVRRSNRIVAMTSHGASVLAIARRLLRDANNIKLVGKDFTSGSTGSINIATTHALGLYLLLPVVTEFRRSYPGVRVRLIQANSPQMVKMVADGTVDIGVGTQSEAPPETVVQLPFFDFRLCVITPVGHPLLKKRTITLEDVAAYPFITLDSASASVPPALSTFEAHGLVLDTVLSATDSAVIKAYVESGLGIAALPEIAFDPKRDRGLRSIPARHLFPSLKTCISMQRHGFLRNTVADFIGMLAPEWTRDAIGELIDSGKQVPPCGSATRELLSVHLPAALN